MDGHTLCAELVKALAWPLSALLIVLLLRKPMLKLVDGLRLSKLRYGEWAAEFELAAEQAKEAVPKNLPPEVLDLPPGTDEQIEASPTAAVLAAWNALDLTLVEVAGGSNSPSFRRRLVTPKTMHAIDGLRQLRNLVVHSPSGTISVEKAREFVSMAEALRWTVKAEAAKAKAPPT